MISTDSDEPVPRLITFPIFFPHSPSTSLAQKTKLTTATTATTLINAAENQPHNFNFSFLPIFINTCHCNVYVKLSLSPHSTSPTGANLTLLGRYAGERTDILKDFEFPSPDCRDLTKKNVENLLARRI